MASSSQTLLPWLLFFSLLFTFTRSFPIKSDKINLVLYYESLCPSCQSFVVNDLVKVFNTDLHSIVNLRLVPYGNAEVVGSNKNISCQHGEDECYLNAIEACAIGVWPDQKRHFRFIRCVESSVKDVLQRSDKVEDIWKSCAHKYGGLKLIERCYENGHATQLILGYANETGSLQPPHTFVPWVTVNSKPLYDKYEHFVAEVCKAYKGGAEAVPIACQSSEPPPKSPKENLPLIQACYVRETRN